jgi:hypothetical protein
MKQAPHPPSTLPWATSDVSQAKQVPLPPPPPTFALGCKCAACCNTSAARYQMQAKQSEHHCPPPSLLWTASTQCKLMHQRPETNASQAKQAKQHKLSKAGQAKQAKQSKPSQAKQAKQSKPSKASTSAPPPTFALGCKHAVQATHQWPDPDTSQAKQDLQCKPSQAMQAKQSIIIGKGTGSTTNSPPPSMHLCQPCPYAPP